MAYNGTTKVLSGLIPENGSAPVADVKDIYVDDNTRLNQKLNAMDQLIGAGSNNKLNSAAVAPAYSASTPYNVGDLVTHEGGFFSCNTTIPAPGEVWNEAHWDAVKAQDVFMTEAAIEAAFVRQETGKSLMTDAERTKLAGIAAGATAVTVDSALTQGGTNPVEGGAIYAALAIIQNMVGSPLVAATAADMTDNTRIYVYTGSETGYTNGNWYYYDGSNWTSGGVYNSTALTTDTTLAIPGAAADAKAVGDKVGSIKSTINDYTITTQKPNLFNKSDVIDGFYYDRTGDIYPSNEWAYSPTYSEINPNEIYYGKYNNNGEWSNAVLAVAWYDESYNFISQTYNVTSYTPPITPIAAKYVRISYKKSSANLTLVFANFQAASEQEYGFIYSLQENVIIPSIENIEDSVEQLNESVEQLSNNIDEINDFITYIDETSEVPSSEITIHDGYYISKTGNEEGPYNNWQYAEYEIGQNNISLTVKAKAGQNARLWVLKDINNLVIGYSTYSGLPVLLTETIDLSNYPTAKKLFVNDNMSDSLLILETNKKAGISGNDVYINGENISEIINENDKLKGKILCCAGDSITYGADMDAEGITNESNITVYNCDSNGIFTQTTSQFRKTWGYQIAERNKMVFYNGGVSGSTMQGLSNRNGFSLENGRYTKLPDTIDYLLIWFGWNDNAYGTLGSITDETNESYYGGYNVVLPYLINKYPYTKIGLIVPFGSSAGHREAVRLLGNKWGVAVWDNYQGGTPLYYGKETSVGVEESIVTENRAKFQANGAHPNYKGHRQLADMIEAWLKGI